MQYLTKVKFSGVQFEFGTQPLIVPALTVGQMEALAGDLDKHDALGKIPTEDRKPSDVVEMYKIKRKVIGEALRRNYPDMVDADVDSFVDGFNGPTAMQAALGFDRTSKRINEVGEAIPVG